MSSQAADNIKARANLDRSQLDEQGAYNTSSYARFVDSQNLALQNQIRPITESVYATRRQRNTTARSLGFSGSNIAAQNLTEAARGSRATGDYVTEARLTLAQRKDDLTLAQSQIEADKKRVGYREKQELHNLDIQTLNAVFGIIGSVGSIITGAIGGDVGEVITGIAGAAQAGSGIVSNWVSPTFE